MDKFRLSLLFLYLVVCLDLSRENIHLCQSPRRKPVCRTCRPDPHHHLPSWTSRWQRCSGAEGLFVRTLPPMSESRARRLNIDRPRRHFGPVPAVTDVGLCPFLNAFYFYKFMSRVLMQGAVASLSESRSLYLGFISQIQFSCRSRHFWLYHVALASW